LIGLQDPGCTRSRRLFLWRKKLPELSRSVGQAMMELKKGLAAGARRSPGRRRSSEPRTSARTSTDIDMRRLSRRSILAWLGSGAAGLAFVGQARAQVAPQAAMPLPSFTRPGPNPYWNGVNPFVSYPQKLPSFV